MSKEDQEVQHLLAKLTELSGQITREPNSPNVARLQTAQAEVMLHLAARSRGKEREDWLRMTIDAYYSAALQAGEADPTGYARLQQLPGYIAKNFPESKLASHAMLQEIQADYVRVLGKATDDPSKAQMHLADRLVRFAQEHPNATEAPKAVLDAAQLCESLKRTDDARRCYAYLAQRYAGTDIARKAKGIQWRLGEGSSPVELNMPPVYATGARGDQPFDMKDVRGKLVVVYFWSSSSPEAEGDFHVLKALTDRYQFKGLEVVYVNLDDDPLKVREFLSGKLTSGTHLHQKGGLNSDVAQRYGIKALPEAFLVGKDGNLIKHSLKAAQLFAEVAAQMPAGK
jgi:hypothetical protein